MRRIKLVLSYDGTSFHGWQVQPGLPTVQGFLQEILGRIEGRPVLVHGSGRTDAGVHALAQVAACDLTNPIPTANLGRAINRLLPPDIRVLSVEETEPSFHPRRDAISKTYEYRICRSEICSPFERRYVHHHPYPLDEERFRRCAKLLEGTHDFSAFAAADDSDALGRSKVRTIFSAEAGRDGHLLWLRLRGSGFLKHMVRNITGTLLEAAKGNLNEEQLLAFLDPQCPRKAGPRAPAQGLFLVGVEYPLPSRTLSV